MNLPPLPKPDVLADVCRETATAERAQPAAVEKDFYLTRLIWALAQTCGDTLLLKGGTLLSKVDLGYYRMSEDVDLVIPTEGSPRQKAINAKAMGRVRDALKRVAPEVGVQLPFPSGEAFDKHRQVIWTLRYDSVFASTAIQVEASMRPVLKQSRSAPLMQLLKDPLVGDYSKAFCWALDAVEARAEKVRAAFTREAGRDFYDLERLHKAGSDLTSKEFLALVDAKLAELGYGPLKAQSKVFGLTTERRSRIEASLRKDLPAVVRIGEPNFELEPMLRTFGDLWGLPL